jgi:hypothetical protein
MSPTKCGSGAQMCIARPAWTSSSACRRAVPPRSGSDHPRGVARRDLETASALPAIDEEHGHPENSKTRTNVDEQGIATIGEPRDGTYGQEHPDDDSDDGQHVPRRVELQLLESLRDSPVPGAIVSHAASVSDHGEE